jgi:hypothetical protein
MSKLIPAAERVVQARALIQKARQLPIPEEAGRYDINYIAQVKSLLQQARDLIKFISYTPSATAEIKNEVKEIFAECDQVDRELLRG